MQRVGLEMWLEMNFSRFAFFCLRIALLIDFINQCISQINESSIRQINNFFVSLQKIKW